MRKSNRQAYVQGQWDSSITRVRPFFQALLDRDSTGQDWLSKLLALSRAVPRQRAADPGGLLPWVSETREYTDRILRQKPYRLRSIPLENCFAKELPPPVAFLSWLIRHPFPGALEKNRTAKSSQLTKEWRDKLFGGKGEAARQEAIDKAMAILEKHGGQGSRNQWWAFEGFAEADCWLETDKLILMIEGKRMESFSGSTDWFSGRSQLLRDIEAVSELAGGKEFGVMVLSETPIAPPSTKMVKAGYPHLEKSKRAALMEHFWGCHTWEEACLATGIQKRNLPFKSSEVVRTVKKAVGWRE